LFVVSTNKITVAEALQNACFSPDMSWTKHLPPKKVLNCIGVADETFMQADRKLSLVERTGLDREKIRVAAFIPHQPGVPVDVGCRRYASYMGKKFRQHGLDFRVEEATSADNLELMLMGAQVNSEIFGTFVFFPTPFGKTEDYFLRRVRPEKDIEGLTVENTGRMALNIKNVGEGERYEGIVPCTARAILTLLNQHESIKAMFPRDKTQQGPTVAIFNNSARIGIPLQSMLMRAGATVALVHRQTRMEVKQHFLEIADIVITAFPASCEEDLVRHIKPGATVIDCSAEGNLHPDIVEKASYISTHDNHLGQITTALALYNTALCALWQRGMHTEALGCR
jgi:methylenetetrahydrofolate dehydrogenase (NADP+)/methenyltetrahydrofolate cyclohydrolase